MKQEEDKFTGLPENAFRELKPGEVYNPLMSPKKTVSGGKPLVCIMGYLPWPSFSRLPQPIWD